jgi:capsular exopolysaccharide synthesis family protein
LANNNRAIARLTQLQSDADTAQQIYAAFLERYKEALAKEGNQQADARVASPGQLPTSPSYPNKPLVVVIAVVLGLFSGALSALVAELMSRGISNTLEAEQNFALPCMAELPTLASTRDAKAANDKRSKDPRLFVVQSPLSRFAEAFRSLRASLALSRAGDPPRLVAVTSSLPSEGKTTTAICLARTAAMSGQRVILVDGDLRQRAVSKILPETPQFGLLEVLSGTVPLEKAIVRDPETDAFVLPLSDAAFTPRDVFGSPAMLKVLQYLKAHFDLVIVDTAPVLALADTAVLCTQMDAVLFLARWRKTSRSAIRTALRTLDAPNIPLAGLAITQVDVREQARSGEGAARYYKEYAKYYAE